MRQHSIVAWWSGGITSAVACKLAIDLYGVDNCTFIFIDTHNEDADTYRFKSDCEQWYGKEIETISAIPDKYDSIQAVWRKYKSLNVATGAVCSTVLKRKVRVAWQKKNEYNHQVFGFEFSLREMKRAFSLHANYPETKPLFPLLSYGYSKQDCGNIIEDAGIVLPLVYLLGFHNNNCLQTGCVQGGVGYWQKMRKEFPDKFNDMADMEHELTDLKGMPVTMLKDQGKTAQETGNLLVFLKPHPDYSHLKSLADMKPQEVASLFDCNGFCSVSDLLPKNKSQLQINFEI